MLAAYLGAEVGEDKGEVLQRHGAIGGADGSKEGGERHQECGEVACGAGQQVGVGAVERVLHRQQRWFDGVHRAAKVAMHGRCDTDRAFLWGHSWRVHGCTARSELVSTLVDWLHHYYCCSDMLARAHIGQALRMRHVLREYKGLHAVRLDWM